MQSLRKKGKSPLMSPLLRPRILYTPELKDAYAQAKQQRAGDISSLNTQHPERPERNTQEEGIVHIPPRYSRYSGDYEESKNNGIIVRQKTTNNMIQDIARAISDEVGTTQNPR